jgi:hypothetical protein
VVSRRVSSIPSPSHSTIAILGNVLLSSNAIERQAMQQQGRCLDLKLWNRQLSMENMLYDKNKRGGIWSLYTPRNPTVAIEMSLESEERRDEDGKSGGECGDQPTR